MKELETVADYAYAPLMMLCAILLCTVAVSGAVLPWMAGVAALTALFAIGMAAHEAGI